MDGKGIELGESLGCLSCLIWRSAASSEVSEIVLTKQQAPDGRLFWLCHIVEPILSCHTTINSETGGSCVVRFTLVPTAM